MKKKIMFTALLTVASIAIASCGKKEGNAISQVLTESTTPTADEDGNIDVKVEFNKEEFHGTMSKPWEKKEPSNKEKRIIAKVQTILDETNLSEDSKLFECIYDDTESNISVWSLMTGDKEEYLDNLGLIIMDNDKKYTFANLYHGKNPVADYNPKTRKLYIACDVVEGTSVHTEVLYAFDIKKDDVKYLALLDPYEVQEFFINKMSFDAHQNNISINVGGKTIKEIVNHEDGIGAMRGMSFGEQIAYEFDNDHHIKVNVTPGIKFGPGTSLYYDDSPTLVADVEFNGKFRLNNIRVAEE